jgi:beta-N-acetylhexosaminidase
MTIHSLISGLAGPVLTQEELSFFQQVQPWGYILFKRNIVDRAQVKALTDSLRQISGRDNVPILIDQEGGRVQRMAPPHWPVYPTGAALGRVYARDPFEGQMITRLSAQLMAHDLREVGINVDCVPVCDVPVAGAHDVIGDRAYGKDAHTVSRLARAAADGLLAGGGAACDQTHSWAWAGRGG